MRHYPAAPWLLMALLAASGCQPRPPEFTAEDATKLRGIFDATVSNISAGDWTTWSKQFAPDAVLQPPNAPSARGRAAILAWGQAFPHVEAIAFGNVQVSGEGNMAFGTSSYVLKLPGAPADSGKQLVVFRRAADGTWSIPALSFTSDLPVPVPAQGTARR